LHYITIRIRDSKKAHQLSLKVVDL